MATTSSPLAPNPGGGPGRNAPSRNSTPNTTPAAALQDPRAVLLTEAAARNARNFTYFPVAAAIGATSWRLLSSRGTTRWIGWFGMIAALVLLVSTLIFVFQVTAIRLLGLAALFGFAGWFLLLGAALSLHAFRGRPPVSIR